MPLSLLVLPSPNPWFAGMSLSLFADFGVCIGLLLKGGVGALLGVSLSVASFFLFLPLGLLASLTRQAMTSAGRDLSDVSHSNWRQAFQCWAVWAVKAAKAVLQSCPAKSLLRALLHFRISVTPLAKLVKLPALTVGLTLNLNNF